MGLGIGATAMVARRIGEKDPEGAARAAVQAMLLALIVAVVLGTVGALLAPATARVMGASPAVIATGRGYATSCSAARRRSSCCSWSTPIFRGAGDAAIAMRVLWLANAINIVLGPLPHLRRRPVPRARRHGRGGRDDDRPRRSARSSRCRAFPPRRAGCRSRGGTCGSTSA